MAIVKIMDKHDPETNYATAKDGTKIPKHRLAQYENFLDLREAQRNLETKISKELTQSEKDAQAKETLSIELEAKKAAEDAQTTETSETQSTDPVQTDTEKEVSEEGTVATPELQETSEETSPVVTKTPVEILYDEIEAWAKIENVEYNKETIRHFAQAFGIRAFDKKPIEVLEKDLIKMQ